MENTILRTVPTKPDSNGKYLFYLHGLIIEEAGIRPKSEEHGYYEYELIVSELARAGFIVISEPREKGTEVIPYAKKVVSEVENLLEHGVVPGNITVVGASKGGVIAAYVSSILCHNDINFVFLAGLFEKCLVDKDLKLYGKVLSIHDSSDKLSITPPLYFQRSEGLGDFKEIVLNLGLGHGVIYKPYGEWMEPLLDFVKQ